MLFFELNRVTDEYHFEVDNLNYFVENDKILILCDCVITKDKDVESILTNTPKEGIYDYFVSHFAGGFFVLVFSENKNILRVFLLFRLLNTNLSFLFVFRFFTY